MRNDMKSVTRPRRRGPVLRGLAAGLALLPLMATAEPLDPTRAPESQGAAPLVGAQPTSLPRLQAIFRAGGRYRAVIDGVTLRVGDALGEAHVLAIDARSVTLVQQGQRERLLLAAPILSDSRSTP